VEAQSPGRLGDADAIITRQVGLPIAVATADCVPVVIEAETAVAVVHAGWRGAAAGVLLAARRALEAAGHHPERAAIGPAIGPCCYEVGPEVVAEFADFVGATTWGTASVDIPSFLESLLPDLEVWRSDECTFTSPRLNSWRRDQTDQRQVTVAWLPNA
jgi:YfiH family protein